MPTNQAAWLTAKSARPLVVKSAPYTPPGANEMVVKNAAIAVNPVDWAKQCGGDMIFSWIKYPFVLGGDLSGSVVEVGAGVTRFAVGDRVLAHAVGMDPTVNRSAESAFQEYTVVRANLASPIPDSLAHDAACVLPLCLSTAACALFQKDFLALDYPAPTPDQNRKPEAERKTLLVWGASTAVGSNAVQLAVAAGYDVVATASPRNFHYVRTLGAAQVFDYRADTAVAEIVRCLKGRRVAGAVAVGDGSLEACIDVVAAAAGAEGGGNKFVAQISVPFPDEMPTGVGGIVSAVVSLVWWNVKTWFKAKTNGVRTKFVFGSTLMNNEVGRVVYQDFLPEALARGNYVAAPEPLVVGNGLEFAQEALDVQKKGVSAKKVVVTL
ncbi:polyketide synthase [Phialemonium atrogriseum]|uniref:Polyketide synthase n=1 Tax=Phialemonium atrogriseum TaxID=1093897 RepID=A0AAJ0C1I2_9PEZI|nr:polyketide synthase [Phialemonium atrogriseum]KAK1765981.1 polyketide synthase [Phialemonium atrogriseum]